MHVYEYVYIGISACVYMYIKIYPCVYIYLLEYAYKYVCMGLHMYIHVYMYICIFTLSLRIKGASLMAQTIKNLPVMQETWVRPLGCEDPLEKGNTYTLQCSCLENSMDRSLVGYSP